MITFVAKNNKKYEKNCFRDNIYVAMSRKSKIKCFILKLSDLPFWTHGPICSFLQNSFIFSAERARFELADPIKGRRLSRALV